MIRVAIADDHAIVRDGLAALLRAEPDLELLGSAADATSFYDLVMAHPPDVAVLDIHMPGVDGFDLASTVLDAAPEIAIVFLTSRRDPASLKRALAIGAKGYVLKDDAFEDLATAVREVASGDRFVSAAIAAFAGEPSANIDLLAPRELEVLRQIAAGRQNKEIGAKLGVSTNTVRTHRARLMDKLDIRSGPELVRFALENGIG